MSHGYTGNRDNGDYMPFTYDPCRGWNWSPIRNHFWWEFVKKIWISEVGRSALICLCVAQLNTLGFVEHLIWDRSSTAGSTNFPGWKCLPAKKANRSRQQSASNTITQPNKDTFRYGFNDNLLQRSSLRSFKHKLALCVIHRDHGAHSKDKCTVSYYGITTINPRVW